MTWVARMKRPRTSSWTATFVYGRTSASSDIWWWISAWRTSSVDWWPPSKFWRTWTPTWRRWVRFGASLLFAPFLFFHNSIERFKWIVNNSRSDFLRYALISWCDYVGCGWQWAMSTRTHLMRHHQVVRWWHTVSLIAATHERWPLHALRRLVRIMWRKTKREIFQISDNVKVI